MADASSIEVEIARLETRIRQLKVQYDMFFAGAVRREPSELRSDVEKMIKRYSNAPIRKYAHRFHFNSLVSRFNSLSELWTKTVRTMEEGERTAAVVARGDGSEVITTCRVHDPIKEQELLRFLHARFLETRRKLGAGKNGKVPFERFVRGVASQAKSIREKVGCDQVELRVVVQDGKVHLKARPGR